MNNPLDESSEAITWVDEAKTQYRCRSAFSKIVGAVLWTEQVGDDLTIDPQVLVSEINTTAFPQYLGHDPGAPIGSLFAAKHFTSDKGAFVVGVMGLYGQANISSFASLGIDSSPIATPPPLLDDMAENCWIDLAADSREVTSSWLEDVSRDAPLPIHKTDLSHNAADPSAELIRIGLVYTALVWNPFVTSVATEAGKHAYSRLQSWVRKLWDCIADCRNPIVDVQSHQSGCNISFLFRGSEVQRNYAAHDALPLAAVQAEKLIASMNARGVAPARLVYEFEPQQGRWFPSYAVLGDERLVSDRNILIALEQVPLGLSLGITRGKDRPRGPKE